MLWGQRPNSTPPFKFRQDQSGEVRSRLVELLSYFLSELYFSEVTYISISLKPNIEHIVICCFLMGDCLLPIFVHSGKRQISPSFCSLVGPCQEIKANFLFGALKNTKKWKIRSVFIFIIFSSTTKLRANSPIKKKKVVFYFTSNFGCENLASKQYLRHLELFSLILIKNKCLLLT